MRNVTKFKYDTLEFFRGLKAVYITEAPPIAIACKHELLTSQLYKRQD
jgi:hypothetical protein